MINCLWVIRRRSASTYHLIRKKRKGIWEEARRKLFVIYTTKNLRNEETGFVSSARNLFIWTNSCPVAGSSTCLTSNLRQSRIHHVSFRTRSETSVVSTATTGRVQEFYGYLLRCISSNRTFHSYSITFTAAIHRDSRISASLQIHSQRARLTFL
jgi:hypothetical protein